LIFAPHRAARAPKRLNDYIQMLEVFNNLMSIAEQIATLANTAYSVNIKERC
jgi:N-methylhydantoinase B/oxoprolinase/acetone carboxylase alpha subunit